MRSKKYTTTDDKERHSHPTDEIDTLKIPFGEEDEDELHLMEQFMLNPAYDYQKLRYGETRDGTIMRIDKDTILVDIGSKSEGIVSSHEMQSLKPEERAALAVGQQVFVFVLQAEDKEGTPILSIDRAVQERSWRTLQHLYETGEPTRAQVVGYNKGGLLVELDGVRGFVPLSQVGKLSRIPETQKQFDMARMIGQELSLKVIEVNRSRNRLILSERQAVEDASEEKKDELISSLRERSICHGTVTSICNFGAFIDIGGVDGLVHLSEISWERIEHPGDVLTVGQTVQVYILTIDRERKRIALSIKRTQKEPWSTVLSRYNLGQMVEGTITQIAPFGAFASLGDGIEGLIHISEFGTGHVNDPRDVVKEGDTVQMRIIRIDPTRKRIGLRLHVANANESPAQQQYPESDDEQTNRHGA